MRLLKQNLNWLVIVLLCASSTAQSKPDFSGRWTSEPEAKAPTGDLGSGWGSNLSIKQANNRLTVEYPFFARGDMQPPLRFVYALDGTETKNSVMMGRGIQVQTSKAAWEGDKLVITTTHSYENPVDGQPLKVEVKQTLTLASPTSLVVETARSGVLGGPPSTTRTIYRK
ncbi:MAG: hypothetical protein HOP19_01885 [Acidobacteria bacterium]|nr:hypothetical protein [Acidobacteriota bacterium]